MLSIIVPVFNEVKTVEEVISRLQSLPVEKQIIVVDDGSSDGTTEVLVYLNEALKSNLQIITHSVNQGKGAAIRTGLQYVSGDIVTIFDADLEYDPDDLARLIPPIQNGELDVVFGSRFLGDYKATHWKYKLANLLLTAFTNVLYGRNLTDVYTCYKVFSNRVTKNLVITSNRFEIEAELTAKVLKQGWRIGEVPISYHPRSALEGKKIKAKDGFVGIWTLIKFRFKEEMDAVFKTA